MKYISCLFHWTIPTGKIFWVEVFEKRMKYISCLFHWTIPTGKICLVNKQVILIAFTQLSKSKHINDNTSFSRVSCGLNFLQPFRSLRYSTMDKFSEKKLSVFPLP